MKELAEFLKSERQNRELTLRSISARSGIGLSMLRCLEAADLECLGSALLIRYTIRGYCKALEIDPQPILEKISSRIDSLKFQELGIKKYGGQMKLLRKKRKRISFSLLLFAVSTAAVLYAGTWISERRAKMYAPPPADRISSQEELPAELVQRLATAEIERRDLRNPAGGLRNWSGGPVETDAGLKETERALRDAERNIRETEKAKEAGKAEEAQIQKEGAQIPAGAAQSAPDVRRVELSHSMEAVAEDRPAVLPPEDKTYRFVVEADAKTWVQVKIDDKHTRGAMLHPGDRREWTARKGMQVVIGNAGGVSMKWDEQLVKAPREPGRVLRFRLPEQIVSIGDD